jgi:translation initiation factor 2 alpha subunit (eIF-2alpha)
LKKDTKAIYEKIKSKLSDAHPQVYMMFEDFVRGDYDLNELGLDKDLTKKLDEIIHQRIKPPRVQISGSLYIVSYAADAVSLIKKALKHGVHDDVDMKYVGAGKYQLTFHAEDYKQCEALMSDITGKIIDSVKESGAEASFERED